MQNSNDNSENKTCFVFMENEKKTAYVEKTLKDLECNFGFMNKDKIIELMKKRSVCIEVELVKRFFEYGNDFLTTTQVLTKINNLTRNSAQKYVTIKEKS